MRFRTVKAFLQRNLHLSNRNQKRRKSYAAFNPASQSLIIPGEERIRASCLLPNPSVLQTNDDDKTVYEAFLRGLRISGNGPCLGTRNRNTGKYEWMCYEEVLEKASAIGSAIEETVLSDGYEKLIGINCSNRNEFTLTYLATTCYSWAFVPIYSTLGTDSVDHIIKETAVPLILCDTEEKGDYLVRQKSQFPALKTIVLTEEPSKEFRTRAQSAELQVVNFIEFENIGKCSAKTIKLPKETDIFSICWTSGTTGMPKGVIVTHGNVMAGVKAVAEVWKPVVQKEPCMISYLPTGHIYETCIQAQFLYEGGRIGYYGGDIENLLNDIKSLRPTYIPMVPRVLNRIYAKAMTEIDDHFLKKKFFRLALWIKKQQLQRNIFSTDTILDKVFFASVRTELGGRVALITSTAATLSSDVALFFQAALGCPILVTYGQTELGPATFTLPIRQFEANVGPPVPSAHVKLVDVPDMQYWAKDDIGEICVRGPTVSIGYYKNPQATSKAIDSSGWLHTGDIGKWLENGTLSLIDRKKNLFKLSQGEFISPEKVESVYSQSPLVAQVFVTGSSDKDFIVGVVVPNKNEFISWMKAKGCKKPMLDSDGLYHRKDVRMYLINHLRSFGQKCGLNSLEQIKNIHLNSYQLKTEDGFLTANLKLKRKAAEKLFQTEILKLYKEGPIC